MVKPAKIDALRQRSRTQLAEIITEQNDKIRMLKHKLKSVHQKLSIARSMLTHEEKLVDRKLSQIRSLKKRVRKGRRRHGDR
jgi:hypothetical protein